MGYNSVADITGLLSFV